MITGQSHCPVIGNYPDGTCSAGRDLRDNVFFAEVYEMYMPRLYYYIYKRIGRHHDAEEVTSVVFLKVLEKRGDYDPNKASFVTWMFSIAKNALIDYFRAQRDEVPLDEIQESEVHATAQTSGLGEDSAESLLACLPEKYAIIMRYRYIYGYSNRQIAGLTGINENTVSTLHQRALQKLRKLVSENSF